MTAALSLFRRTLRIFGEWASVVTRWAGSFLMYGISLLPSGSSRRRRRTELPPVSFPVPGGSRSPARFSGSSARIRWGMQTCGLYGQIKNRHRYEKVYLFFIDCGCCMGRERLRASGNETTGQAKSLDVETTELTFDAKGAAPREISGDGGEPDLGIPGCGECGGVAACRKGRREAHRPGR